MFVAMDSALCPLANLAARKRMLLKGLVGVWGMESWALAESQDTDVSKQLNTVTDKLIPINLAEWGRQF